MPRYLIERNFPDGLEIPVDARGVEICRSIIQINSDDNVTWIQSYVSNDKKKSFCIYDAPTPEAIRRVAVRNKLPVNKITEIIILDPYFYK